MPKGAREPLRLCLMHLLPNGDWRDRSEVAFWLQSLGGIDQEAFMDQACWSTVHVLLNQGLRAWVPSKWNGAEEACCDQLLADLVCGLLTDGIEELCARKKRTYRREDPSHGDASSRSSGGQNNSTAVVPLVAAASVLVKAGYDPSSISTAGIPKHASISLAWVRQPSPSPLAEMMLWRFHVSILAELLRNTAKVGAKAWELKEQAKGARAFEAGADQLVLQRDFRILVSARQTLESVALRRLV